ncbi:MAG TPA: aldo/keto reductase [Solirubrobacteraceae bacterium]
MARGIGELGIDFLDTAQLYGPMTNEQLVGRAIEEDLARIEAELPPVAGERYDRAGMASVNL